MRRTPGERSSAADPQPDGIVGAPSVYDAVLHAQASSILAAALHSEQRTGPGRRMEGKGAE